MSDGQIDLDNDETKASEIDWLIRQMERGIENNRRAALDPNSLISVAQVIFGRYKLIMKMVSDRTASRIKELEGEVERLERLVYVPGLWRCAKCSFSLLQSNLNSADGSVTARDEPGDKCPNCDSPLWRVTERDAGKEMGETAERIFDEKRAALADNERLREALKHLKDCAVSESGMMPISVVDAICDAALKEHSQ